MIGDNLKGQSTLEILIALAIITISISAVILVSFGSQSVLIDSQYNNTALYLAKENLEKTRAEARQNFNAANSTSTTDGVYIKEIIIENLETYKKKIISRVSWQNDLLRPQKIELTTILADWKSAMPPDPNDSGGSGISGNWQNPRTLGSIDLGPGNSATDLDVVNKIVYLSAEASAQTKPDFFIIDATNGQNPFIVSSLNTGKGLNAVDVSGNYAYVANQNNDAQLQIINVSDRANPIVISSFKLPGVSGSEIYGQSLFYKDSKVYIGIKKAVGPEFHVIDVSDPANPASLGSFEINDNINDIYVLNQRAYLATDLDGAGLIVLDIANPSAIALLGQSYLSDTKSVFVSQPSKTLLGPAQDLSIADTGNPSAIVALGSISAGNAVNNIVAKDYLAFIGSSNSNREFQVINISNPNNPTLWSYFNFSQVATGIDYENNLVYVSVRSNDALRIITSQ